MVLKSTLRMGFNTSLFFIFFYLNRRPSASASLDVSYLVSLANINVCCKTSGSSFREELQLWYSFHGCCLLFINVNTDCKCTFRFSSVSVGVAFRPGGWERSAPRRRRDRHWKPRNNKVWWTKESWNRRMRRAVWLPDGGTKRWMSDRTHCGWMTAESLVSADRWGDASLGTGSDWVSGISGGFFAIRWRVWCYSIRWWAFEQIS